MKTAHDILPASKDIFLKFVYGVIILLWLKFAVEMFFEHSPSRPSFYWEHFVSSLFFTLFITFLVLLLNNRFHHHLLNRVQEYKRLFKKNPYPMWVYDLKTSQFLGINDAAISLYGYSEAEFLSMKISAIRPQEDVPAIINESERVKLSLNSQYHWSGTWRHKRKNGDQMYVEVSSHEILFNGREAELVLAYDVTDKIHQEQRLQALNQDLEKKVMGRTNDQLLLNTRLVDQNKIIRSANLELFTITTQLQEANLKIHEHADLKNRFVSMASHEFRTPLANIAMAAGFIRHHLNKLEPQNIISKLKGIETHVAHMAALIEDVLTIEKADATKLEVKNDLLDLDDFIAKICQEVRTASDNSHHIQVNMNENVMRHLQADEKFLRNIFINLINNAIKYSPGAKHVYINIDRQKDEIFFEIIDKGLGINKNELSKIFEPFYRANSTSHIQGTGLGLSIVKRAADLLGAQIRVQSEIGQGSTFTVVLPVSVSTEV